MLTGSVAVHSLEARLHRVRDLLLRWGAAEKLAILSICLIYLLHSIWAARTVMWFFVVPVVLLSVTSYRRLAPIVTSGVFVMTAAYLLLIIITTMLGDSLPGKELFSQFRYTVAILFFIIVIAYLTWADDRFVPRLFMWLAPVAAFAAVRDIGSFSGWSLHTMLTTRLQGTPGLSIYYNSNVIGMLYAMSCVGAVALMTTRRLPSWQSVMLFSCALILLVATTMTGSRGSLLAATMGILASLLLKPSWRAAMIAVSVLAVAAVVTLLMPVIGQWMASGGVQSTSLPIEMVQRGDSTRLELWPEYLKMAALKPWLGYGLAFDTQVTLPSGKQVMNAHNMFLCAAVRGGVFSALALAGIVLAAFASGWRGFRRTGEMMGLALLVSCLAATSVDYEILPTDLNYFYVLIWLPVAICLGLGLAPCSRTVSGVTRSQGVVPSQNRS